VGTVLALFAARYKAAQSETASMLLISTLALAYGAGDTLDKQVTGGSKLFCSRSVSSLIVKVGASFPNGGFYVEKRC
jgi:hypothetical protein